MRSAYPSSAASNAIDVPECGARKPGFRSWRSLRESTPRQLRGLIEEIVLNELCSVNAGAMKMWRVWPPPYLARMAKLDTCHERIVLV